MHDNNEGPSSDPAWLEASILASESDDARATSPGPAPAGEGNRRTVLVVAIDPDMRTYVRQCLAHITSIQVMEAADVPATRGIARTMPPDVIVVDVEGGPAGVAVDRMVGGQPHLTNVPLIVISDEAPSNSRESVRSGTAPETILVKPFNARRLCTEVHRLLSLEP